jgi:hypothetical protein
MHWLIEYLVLGDLTWKRQWPCIMDVKGGTRSDEDDATQEKIEYERSKFPLQEKVGFRIQGIKVYDTKEKKYVEYDKHFGRGMKTHEAIVDAFRKYFYDGNTIKREVIEQVSFVFLSSLDR